MTPAERLHLLGQLVRALSHDFAQPLNGIRLSAEAAADRLARGEADPARMARSLAAISGQVERLQEAIDELRAVAGVDEADAPGRFLVVEAVRRALAAGLPRLAAEDIRLRWHAQLPSPLVDGSARAVQRAVGALLDNACDAISAARAARQEDGGRQDGGVIDVTCRIDCGSVVVRLDDDGCGFPPRVLAGLGKAGASPQGQRIGLTVAAGVAAQMGGRLAATNRAVGARVELVLPPAQSEVADGPPNSLERETTIYL